MINADKPRFAELMAWLAQTFSCDISNFDIENYWRHLNKFSLSDVEQAAMNYSRHPEGHQFIPKPGEIIAYIEGNSTSQAMQAWAKVMRAVTHIGSYNTVIFDDPIIHAVLHDMGGWIKLNEMAEKDVPYRAREFEKLYASYLINKPTEYLKQLSGITETSNSAFGYETKIPPILIGDEKRALAVFQNGQDAAKLLQFKPLSPDILHQLTKPESANNKAISNE